MVPISCVDGSFLSLAQMESLLLFVTHNLDTALIVHNEHSMLSSCIHTQFPPLCLMLSSTTLFFFSDLSSFSSSVWPWQHSVLFALAYPRVCNVSSESQKGNTVGAARAVESCIYSPYHTTKPSSNTKHPLFEHR